MSPNRSKQPQRTSLDHRQANSTARRPRIDEQSRQKRTNGSGALTRAQSGNNPSSRVQKTSGALVSRSAKDQKEIERRLKGSSSVTPARPVRESSSTRRKTDGSDGQAKRSSEKRTRLEFDRANKTNKTQHVLVHGLYSPSNTTKRYKLKSVSVNCPPQDFAVLELDEINGANDIDEDSELEIVSRLSDSEEDESSSSMGEPDEAYTEPSSEPEPEPSIAGHEPPTQSLPPDCSSCKSEPLARYIQCLPPRARLQACQLKLSYYQPSNTHDMPASHKPLGETGKTTAFLWTFITTRLQTRWDWQNKLVEMLAAGQSDESTCVMSHMLQDRTRKPTRYFDLGPRPEDHACHYCVTQCLPCVRLVRVDGVARLSVASLPRDCRPGRTYKQAQYYVMKRP